MDRIIFEIKGHRYEVPEPCGEDALALFNVAMGACIKAHALDAFAGFDELGPREQSARVMTAALKLSGLAEGHAVARATLLGATVDGNKVTADTYAATFARPGRYIEPHIAALTVWLRAGFFGDGTTSKDGAPSEGEGLTGGD